MAEIADEMNESPDSSRSSRRCWWSLGTVSFGVMIVFLNITGTFTILAPLQAGLHLSTTQLAWVTSAYSLVIGSLILTAGTVGDIIGRRRAFLMGTATLAVGAIVMFLAGAFVPVAAGQAVMGLGGAFMVPNSLAIVSDAFPDNRDRTVAIGIWSASTGVGMAIGPLVAGLLLVRFAWRSVFLVVGIAAGLLALATSMLVGESRALGRRIDLPGMVVATVTITALIFSIIEGVRLGFLSPTILTGIAVVVCGLVAFVLIERRTDDPMVDLSLFRSAPYSAVMFVGAASLFGFTGSGLLALRLFQRADHLTTLDAALRILPLFLAFIVASAATSVLLRCIGTRWTLLIGSLFGTSGALLALRLEPAAPYASTWPTLLVLGAGLGVLLTTASTTAIAIAPHDRTGMASATLNLFRQLGTVLAAAIITLLSASAINDTQALGTGFLVVATTLAAIVLAIPLVEPLNAVTARRPEVSD